MVFKTPFATSSDRHWSLLIWMCLVLLTSPCSLGQSPDRYVWTPEANQAWSFSLDGLPRVGWNFGPNSPRPYFFPVIGTSGTSLTRMGHPGAPDHDHHRSVWFAHNDVEGHDFWSDHSGTRIVQREWRAIEGDSSGGRIAVDLDWMAKDGEKLLSQELVVDIHQGEQESMLIEVQSHFYPAEGRDKIVFRKTNFGLFAVRVSQHLSHVFGNGSLTSAEADVGEPAIFGRAHRWVDYSGASPSGIGSKRHWEEEGITYFDHPSNVGFPNKWHVRDDGWMCVSPCMDSDLEVTSGHPLELRYLLDVHVGKYDPQHAERTFDAFAQSSRLVVKRAEASHVRWDILRE